MRRLNAERVVAVIRAGQGVTRSDVYRATGLTKPTVNEITALLIDADYVSEHDPDDGRPTRRGPKARSLRFREAAGCVLGIEIGPSKIVALACDLSGAILGHARIAVGERMRPDLALLIKHVRDAAADALRQAGGAGRQLWAVGVGTPGSIDPSTGSAVIAPTLPAWVGAEPVRAMRESFSCPVLFDNEVRLSLLAEHWRGAARGVEDAVFVNFGIGIGVGILSGGQLLRGCNGISGEIGYLPLLSDDDPPEEGFGALEWAAGARAYGRLGRRLAKAPAGRLLRELAGGDLARIDAELVFEAVRRNDRAAQELMHKLLDRLAFAISGAICLLDPAIVIIGGDLLHAADLFLGPVVARSCAHLPGPSPRFAVSMLGDDSVALGAIRLAKRSADDRLLDFIEHRDPRRSAAA